MTRYVGYIAMSLDGRIADGEGRMDWLIQFNDPENDYGFAEFFDGIDAIVMGRATYDFVASQDVWPYPDVITYVVTSRFLAQEAQNVATIAPDFNALRKHLSHEKEMTIWVMGGGQTQRGALDADMFDEIQLFVMPVILGSGPLVFSDGTPTGATLVDHIALSGGVVRLTYQF